MCEAMRELRENICGACRREAKDKESAGENERKREIEWQISQLQFRCKLNENTKDVINFLIIFTFGANWFVNQTQLKLLRLI